MWNEPNLGYSWKPKPSASQYASLALAVGSMKRQEFPHETLVGPGMVVCFVCFAFFCVCGGFRLFLAHHFSLTPWTAASSFAWDFLDAVFSVKGMGDVFDMISVHGYSEEPPELWMENAPKLANLVKEKTGRSLSVLCSEWGQSSHGSMTEDKQARWLTRQYLAALQTHAPISIWYDWHDDYDENSSNPEAHFGTVRHRYYPGRSPCFDVKPAFSAAGVFMERLRGTALKKELVSDHGLFELYAWLFAPPVSPEKETLVAWSARDLADWHHTEKVDGVEPSSCWSGVDYLGNPVPRVCADTGGVLTLEGKRSRVARHRPALPFCVFFVCLRGA
jgi:hypothetical protein